MQSQTELTTIKEIIEEFLQHMTLAGFVVEVALQADVVEANIQLQEPQFLIGSQGQTLSDLGRLIGIITAKKLKKNIQVKLDINDYKKKKVGYLKTLAKDLADEATFTKEKKILEPMSSFERMVIHSELAGRIDVKTESWGEGDTRHVVISPK